MNICEKVKNLTTGYKGVTNEEKTQFFAQKKAGFPYIVYGFYQYLYTEYILSGFSDFVKIIF